MIVSYKYRAYPDAITEGRLNTTLDTCRWLYNKLLEECHTARENGSTPTMRGTQARIVTLKDENPTLKDVYSKVLQMVNYTLWSNMCPLEIGSMPFKAPGYCGAVSAITDVFEYLQIVSCYNLPV